MNSILSKVWNRNKTSLASSPFNVVVNSGWDSAKRLDDIYKFSRWPPQTDYVAYDFLRYEPKAYKIHINSMGFRGNEVNPIKPKNTYRILAYGSYMTFGQSVNDDEVYISRAEKIVNTKLKGKSVEILNGGMETGTFIMGLSRLKHELESTNADAVLFEYGFVDQNQLPHDKIADNYMTLIGHPEQEAALNQNFKERFISDAVKFYGKMEFYLYKSKVYTAFREKILQNTGDAVLVGFDEMRKALTKTSKELAAKGKKVFIVINPVLPEVGIESLKNVAKDSGAILVDGQKFFEENPPSSQLIENFDNDKHNFLTEIGFKRSEMKWANGYDFKIYAPYFNNIFQLSPDGQRVMGEGLAVSILDYLESSRASRKKLSSKSH